MRRKNFEVLLIKRRVAAKTDYTSLANAPCKTTMVPTLVYHPVDKFLGKFLQAEDLMREASHERLVSSGWIWIWVSSVSRGKRRHVPSKQAVQP